MSQVHVIEHALVRHNLAVIRDRTTSPAIFRDAIRRLSVLLAAEATRDLATETIRVETPLTMAEGQRLAKRIGLVPILRAGLGMADPILDFLLPDAEVRHLGYYRDERSLSPVEYYRKLPEGKPVDVALVLDPMLATGGSSIAALEAVRDWGVPSCKLLSIIAAPEGIRQVTARLPEAEIHVCVIDSHLNEHGYIVPGLGDAGDRIFNT